MQVPDRQGFIEYDEQGNVTVHAKSAAAEAVALPVKLTVTMPLKTMVKAFSDALDRYAAATADERATDAHIALFEAFAWFDSLCERRKGTLGGQDVKAVLFARKRTHHQWAAATYGAPGGWRWYRLEILPDGDPKYPDRKGERLYSELLAEKPVLDVLRRIEARVTKQTTPRT